MKSGLEKTNDDVVPTVATIQRNGGSLRRPFGPEMIRDQFPALRLLSDGKEVVFLDGPGGTQVPHSVIAAMSEYMATSNGLGGWPSLTSQRTDAMLAEARQFYAEFLNASSPAEIRFGQNMTSLTFQVSRSVGATLQPGDRVIVSRLDHEANVSPWQALAERGVDVRTVDVSGEGCSLDMSDLASQLSARTKVVAIGYASNAIGTVNPVQKVCDLAHSVGAITYVDAVHYAPHGSMDVAALGCDALVCSAHKFYGPHLGILWMRGALLELLPAYKVRPAPDKIEIGSQNHEGIAGALAAGRYLEQIGVALSHGPQQGVVTDRRARLCTAMDAIEAYESALCAHLLSRLREIPGIVVHGFSDRSDLAYRTPTVAITVKDRVPHELAVQLAAMGIFVSAGDFYARMLIERMGLGDKGGVLRIGLVHYNTMEEVDRLIDGIGRALSES